MKLVSWIFIVFGCLSLISVFVVAPEGRHDYWYMLSIAVSFIILGIFGLEYKKRSYKGGVATIVGAILAIMGIQYIVFFIEQLIHFEDLELISGAIITIPIFLVSGIALLKRGHKTHISSFSENQ